MRERERWRKTRRDKSSEGSGRCTCPQMRAGTRKKHYTRVRQLVIRERSKFLGGPSQGVLLSEFGMLIRYLEGERSSMKATWRHDVLPSVVDIATVAEIQSTSRRKLEAIGGG